MVVVVRPPVVTVVVVPFALGAQHGRDHLVRDVGVVQLLDVIAAQVEDLPAVLDLEDDERIGNSGAVHLEDVFHAECPGAGGGEEQQSDTEHGEEQNAFHGVSSFRPDV